MNTTWREELAWSAGFFDGEGWVGSYAIPTQKRPARARLQITQVDRRTLDRFRSAVGGIGKVFGPYPVPKNPNANPRHDFIASDLPQVQAIVTMLWTFLSPVKRAQAIGALTIARDAARTMPGRGLYKKVCKRGHDLTNVPVREQSRGRVRVCLVCRADYMRQHRADVKRLAACLLVAE